MKNNRVCLKSIRLLGNFRQSLKRNYEDLYFNHKKLNSYNVNLSVIESFKYCNKLENLDDFPDVIKKYIEENKTNEIQDCIDLLGVYIAPTDNDNANILLSKEKIQKVAKNYGMDEDIFYVFIKIHEYAHASMCPKLTNEKDCKVEKSDLYIFIEESLATAIALKIVENEINFSEIKKFVKNQPPQYSYGLVLHAKYGNHIDEVMSWWKKVKCTEKSYSDFLKFLDIDIEKLRENMYELTGCEKYLPQEAQDIFIF